MYGYCKCGCGQKTNIPKINNISCGYVKGVPMAYVSGHNAKRRKISDETKKKLSKSKQGEKNPMWGKKRTKKNEEALRKVLLGNKWNKGRKLSLETRQKMSKYRSGRKRPELTGDKSPNWRGGVTSEYIKARSSLEYRQWRTAVFERDNYTCVWCGYRSGTGKHINLNADHIKPFAFFPLLRYEVDNGRTLCEPCHNKTKIPSHKMREIYELHQIY